ncbi:hypothetical protein [Streptosporangium sp. V21-05]|uniref:hypothetical protein n=1 Tax=Streptosporangium sp. V21-05 TaxID=3446115 RepID=UPI003F531CCF
MRHLDHVVAGDPAPAPAGPALVCPSRDLDRHLGRRAGNRLGHRESGRPARGPVAASPALGTETGPLGKLKEKPS